MANPSVANLAMGLANKPFATLGEIATQRSDRDTAQLKNEIARFTLQNEAGKAQQEAAGRERADRQRALVQDAFTKFGRPDGSVDQKAVIAYVEPHDYEAAEKLRAAFTKLLKDGTEARKGELENEDKQWGLIGQSLQGVTPETYAPVWSRIKAIDPEMADFLGPQYDPSKVQTALAMGTKRDEYNKQEKVIWDRGEDAKKTALNLLSISQDQAHADEAMAYAKAAGVDDDLAQMGFGQWTPETPQRAAQFLMGPKEVATLAQQKANAEASQANTAADNARLAAEAAEAARHNRAIEGQGAQRIAQAGAGGSATAGGDASDIADAIIRGEQPPSMTGLYGKTAAVRGQLARKGYNLTKATEDWTATQKYLNTLNGAQQVRLRQAVEFTRESLPTIRSLVKEWDSSGLPLLSRGNLEAAASGTYGKAQQSLAVRLKGQIADLQSELGTVYKGGNSSTDESLRLASENLKADWSKKAALDAIDQIDKNLTIRMNSIRNTGVVGNDNNAYAPKNEAPKAKKTADELLSQYGAKK